MNGTTPQVFTAMCISVEPPAVVLLTVAVSVCALIVGGTERFDGQVERGCKGQGQWGRNKTQGGPCVRTNMKSLHVFAADFIAMTLPKSIKRPEHFRSGSASSTWWAILPWDSLGMSQ